MLGKTAIFAEVMESSRWGLLLLLFYFFKKKASV